MEDALALKKCKIAINPTKEGDPHAV